MKVGNQPVVRLKSWGWPHEFLQEDVRAALEAAEKPVRVLDVQPKLRDSGLQEAGKFWVTCMLPRSGMRQLLVPDEAGTVTVSFAAAKPVSMQPAAPQPPRQGGGGGGRGGGARQPLVMGNYMAALTQRATASAAATAA